MVKYAAKLVFLAAIGDDCENLVALLLEFGGQPRNWKKVAQLVIGHGDDAKFL